MAAQDDRESITSLATDEDNTVFVSGDTMGYVRVSQYTTGSPAVSSDVCMSASFLRGLPLLKRAYSACHVTDVSFHREPRFIVPRAL